MQRKYGRKKPGPLPLNMMLTRATPLLLPALLEPTTSK
jgi:hypothetical protein